MLDSFGRVLFTRWDHLQRDQQADSDAANNNTYGTFNYTDESANSVPLFNQRAEIFRTPHREREFDGAHVQSVFPVADQRRRHRGGNAQSRWPAGVGRLPRTEF
jgi:hypothetical protein